MTPISKLFCPYGLLYNPVGVLKMPELTPFLYISSNPCDSASVANFWPKKTGRDSLLSPAVRLSSKK